MAKAVCVFKGDKIEGSVSLTQVFGFISIIIDK